MQPSPCHSINKPARTFAVFFYGLNMDAEILPSKGVVPREPRTAHIVDFTVLLGEKAMLLRSPDARAYGILFQLTHREMDTLYGTLHDYRAEPVLAVLQNGAAVAAVTMVHLEPPIGSAQDPVYASHFEKLIRQLGLPATTTSH